MEKSTIGKDVYYDLVWSPIYQFEKYRARGIPEMPGVLCLLQQVSDLDFRYLLFFSCWRNGLRIALRNLTEVSLTKVPMILPYVESEDLYFKYTIIENSIQDMNDIMYWLIKEYKPEYNNWDFIDSNRYVNIYIKESKMDDIQIVEKYRKKNI